jgi:hypothetical protein
MKLELVEPLKELFKDEVPKSCMEQDWLSGGLLPEIWRKARKAVEEDGFSRKPGGVE